MDNGLVYLDPDQLEELEKLAALGYTHDELAMYFLADKSKFIQSANDPESLISFHIKRGKLMSTAREQLQIMASAEGGNITASQQLEKIRRTRGFEISKLDIFGGFEDKEAYQKLESFIMSEGKVDLSAEESIYLEALTMMNSMDRKYGRRKTIAFFTKPPFNLKYSSAAEMYDEALNLFYTDRNQEKKAVRHKYAELLEEAALLARTMAVSSKDLEVYGNLMTQAAKVRQLDKADPEPIPKELYLRPVRVFSLDPETVGITAINRQDVASQIEALEIPERDKIRLRKDALLEAINIGETLDELQEESKNR